MRVARSAPTASAISWEPSSWSSTSPALNGGRVKRSIDRSSTIAWGFSLRVLETPPAPPEPPDEGGCSCATNETRGTGAFVAVLLVGALFGLRRRR